MDIPELYKLFLRYPAVTTDSRRCQPDSIFFALKGENFDGNLYAGDALDAGCAYAVVDSPAAVTGGRVIQVNSVLTTLQLLARLHRQTLRTTLIGITGTNGKTTTKELVASVLSKKYNTLCTEGNLNNHIGVPLTLLRLTRRHEIGVIEMGANHPGEIGALAAIACPDYGLITNAGMAHLEGFGSLEGVIKTKGELYDYIRTRPRGKIFINRNDRRLMQLAAGMDRIEYGAMVASGKNAPLAGGEVIQSHPALSFVWRLYNSRSGRMRLTDSLEAMYAVRTNLTGDYNLWNALAAIATGVHFKVPHALVNEAIAAYQPTNNRSQLQKTKHNCVVMDAYNANPSSMKVAIRHFASSEAAPKAVILGDMLELGEQSRALHAGIIRLVNRCGFDRVFLCGEHFAAAGKKYPCFPDVEALAGHLAANPLQGYEILVKGSHGVHLEKIIDNL